MRTETNSKELALIDLPEKRTLFNGSSLDRILADIEAKVRGFQLDATSESGRREIASVAYKIAKSKTAIDDQGKKLVAGIKAEAKLIDSERKKARDFLDELKAEIRKPLTDFENAEKERVSNHEARLENINSAMLEIPEGSESIASMRGRIEAIDPDTFEEFATKASAAKSAALEKLTAAYEKAVKTEAEAAELERLRQEKAERERIEREEKLKSEAAEQARREAEKKAAAEKLAAEKKAEKERLETQRKHEAELAAQKAEVEAKERAIREEQERKAAAEKKAAAEQAKREADEKHRAKIKTEILASLSCVSDLKKSPELCVAIFDALHAGEIHHVSIRY